MSKFDFGSVCKLARARSSTPFAFFNILLLTIVTGAVTSPDPIFMLRQKWSTKNAVSRARNPVQYVAPWGDTVDFTICLCVGHFEFSSSLYAI